MRPDSDIDLLLVRSDGPDDTWDAQVNDLVSTVSAWTGNDLRPLVYTLAELAASRGEPVLLDILVSGSRLPDSGLGSSAMCAPRRAR